MNTETPSTHKPVRPAACLQAHLDFLNSLRDCGKINMLGARPYLKAQFSLTGEESLAILSYWMETAE